MKKSKIEWTETTWNPVTGCSKKSLGCDNCYAEKMHKRLHAMAFETGKPLKYRHGFNKIVCHPEELKRSFGKKPKMIFVNSMSDLFHEYVPFEFTEKVFEVIRSNPQHVFQVLTKRTERLLQFEGDYFLEKWPKNLWMGVSVENQEAAEKRIPQLLQTSADVKWVSLEPLLGPVKLKFCGNLVGEAPVEIDWIVAGGESGPGARPMHPDWVRQIRDDCIASRTPFFFKQWGDWLPGEQTENSGTCYRRCDNGEIYPSARCARDNFGTHDDPNSGNLIACRIGKKKAGRKLDGREHNEYPEGMELKDAKEPVTADLVKQGY